MVAPSWLGRGVYQGPYADGVDRYLFGNSQTQNPPLLSLPMLSVKAPYRHFETNRVEYSCISALFVVGDGHIEPGSQEVIPSGLLLFHASCPSTITQQGGKLSGTSPQTFRNSSGQMHGSYDALMGSTSKRLMCLMSDTGGGHRASAQALKDGLEVLYD